MKFASTDALMVGPHAITINYKLDLYSAVTSPLTFTFNFYQFVTPVAPATDTYQVTNQTLEIPILMKLNAVIGKEASLLLPEITGVSYIVLGKPRYQVSVDGLLLKVKSDSDSDIGSHKLKINSKTSSFSANITVNVIFSSTTTTAKTALSKTENSASEIAISKTENSTAEIAISQTENPVLSV
jgi:hypothetical protein